MRSVLFRVQVALIAGAIALASAASAQPPDPYEPPSEGPGHDMIESFEANVRSNRRVELVWTFEVESRGNRITCTIDPANDGIAEYTIDDCASTRTQSHRYDEAGEYAAVLLATDRDGNSDRATVRFRVQ
jgi:hypothetical protein